MFSIQYFNFLILKLFKASATKLIKLRIRINFVNSSSDLP